MRTPSPPLPLPPRPTIAPWRESDARRGLVTPITEAVNYGLPAARHRRKSGERKRRKKEVESDSGKEKKKAAAKLFHGKQRFSRPS